MSTKGADDTEGSVYVLDYNLQTYVPIPVTGFPPVFQVDNREELTGEVVWKDESGTVLPVLETFQPSTVYQADIRFTPKPGYAFNPDSAFAYHPGKIKTQIDNLVEPTRTITITYNNSDDADFTFVTDYNLESYVPIPMTGEHPVRVVNTRAEMTIVVGWNETSSGDPISDNENFTFEGGVIYQAVITLTVKPGYRFAADKNFAYPDGMVTTQPNSESHREARTLSPVVYKPAREPVAVSDFDLTPYIPKPVSNMTPVWSFSGSQYSGTIIWKNDATQAVLSGPFQYNTAYTAELTLTPASGYTLKNIGQNGFIHSGTLSCTNPAGGAFVTLNFSETGSAGSPTMVYDTNLTNRLPKPVHGASPLAAFGGPQYTGAVSWKDSNNQHFAGTFQTGMSYAAVVTLTPKAGYTFLGIKQNVFTHAAALSGGVTNAAGSGTITINFSPVDSLNYYAETFGPVTNEKSALWLMKEKRDSSDPVTIEIRPGTEPVEAEKAILAGHFTSPTHITIDGQGRTLELQTKGTLITVGDGVTLTLLNITLQGIDNTHSLGENNRPLAIVQRGGKLILGEGAVLTRNRTTANIGGVRVTDEGELIMHQGAQIKKMSVAPTESDDMTHGGGVVIDGNGKFTMTGGIIGGEDPDDGNITVGEFSGDSGGGVLVKRGIFTMSGGKIRNNLVAASNSAGGVLVLQGGVFNMSGGEISKNSAEDAYSAGGVASLNGTEAPLPEPQFTMSGNALIADNKVMGYNSGGGVLFDFTMNGGTIRNNVAEGESSGGGVYSYNIIMYGGTITGNKALGSYPSRFLNPAAAGSGGGVYGNLTMYGGTIVGNEATDAYSGGGVHGEITMYGGTIGGENGDANKADGENSANNVFISLGSHSIMSGGTINGTTANTNQCGVYLSYVSEYYKATFTMSGSAKVDPKNYVFLTSGTVLAIGGRLTTDGVAVNIICESPDYNTDLLETSNLEYISSSYLKKIRYDNGSEHINSSCYPILDKYYIRYQE
jgi:hypothetical protein